jgi:hypothetical protein
LTVEGLQPFLQILSTGGLGRSRASQRIAACIFSEFSIFGPWLERILRIHVAPVYADFGTCRIETPVTAPKGSSMPPL